MLFSRGVILFGLFFAGISQADPIPLDSVVVLSYPNTIHARFASLRNERLSPITLKLWDRNRFRKHFGEFVRVDNALRFVFFKTPESFQVGTLAKAEEFLPGSSRGFRRIAFSQSDVTLFAVEGTDPVLVVGDCSVGLAQMAEARPRATPAP